MHIFLFRSGWVNCVMWVKEARVTSAVQCAELMKQLHVHGETHLMKPRPLFTRVHTHTHVQTHTQKQPPSTAAPLLGPVRWHWGGKEKIKNKKTLPPWKWNITNKWDWVFLTLPCQPQASAAALMLIRLCVCLSVLFGSNSQNEKKKTKNKGGRGNRKDGKHLVILREHMKYD